MKANSWESVNPLTVCVGDVLRVKLDAYRSDAGKIHNGRIVKVNQIKDGDVYVTTVDYKSPHIQTARHSPYVLERAVR
jgi:hypothetical protein